MKHLITYTKIIASLILISLFIYVLTTNETSKTTESGQIIIVVVNEDNKVVENKVLPFKKNDTLNTLLDRNYEIDFMNSSYGNYILSISDNEFSVKTTYSKSWLWLEIGYLKDGCDFSSKLDLSNYNISSATTSIDNIKLVDNMVFSLSYQDNHVTNNLATAYNDKVVNNIDMSYLYLIFGLIAIIMLIVVIKSKHEVLSVKDIAVISCLAVILIVQEYVLMIIPNFQLTFVLLLCFAQTLGIKKSSLILFVYIIIDNLLIGSLTPFVMIPMWISLQLLIILSYLVKQKNMVINISMSIFCSIFYGFSFFIVNSYVFNYNYDQMKIYLIADIPFTLLLVISTIFTVYNFKNIFNKIIINSYN